MNYSLLQIPYGKKGGKDFILKSLTERLNVPFKPVNVSSHWNLKYWTCSCVYIIYCENCSRGCKIRFFVFFLSSILNKKRQYFLCKRNKKPMQLEAKTKKFSCPMVLRYCKCCSCIMGWYTVFCYIAINIPISLLGYVL